MSTKTNAQRREPRKAKPGGRDETGRMLFPVLARRGIARNWATALGPVEDLETECAALAGDPGFMSEFGSFIQANPIVPQSCSSMLAHLALVAGVRWQDTAPVLHPLSKRGWHIGRWLPTFLLMDGPLGRVLTKSPLSSVLRTRYGEFRLLTDARDAFNNDTFRRVRNGFAHWSFEWVSRRGTQEIRIVDWKTGRETERLTLLECEALHFLTLSVVEAIDVELLAHCRAGGNQALRGRALRGGDHG